MIKAAGSEGQTTLLDYFDYDKFSDEETAIFNCEAKNLCGKKETEDFHVKLWLKLIFENAQKNSNGSKHGFRHNTIVKKFGAALNCLVGKSGYDLLHTNLGTALPSISTVQRLVTTKKIKEGVFYFNELKDHLQEWSAPLCVNIHIDDTRVKNLVEYDSVSDQYIGFCLNGTVPPPDQFRFETFEEIKSAFENNATTSYAHCIVAKSFDIMCPSFILCVIDTDSKYDHDDVSTPAGPIFPVN